VMKANYYFTLIIIWFCLTSSIAIHAQVNLNLGLQLHLPFNGNANDASGNGNNAIVNDAILTTDQYGNANSAYLFDGIDDYLAVPHSTSLALGNAISMVAKVNVSSFYTGLCEANIIFQKGITDFLPGWYSMRYSCGGYYNGTCGAFSPNYQNFYANVQNNNALYPFGIAPGQLGAPPYIQTNNWYCVITTWDGDSMKVFVDGALYGKWAHVLTPGINTDSLTIGCIRNNIFPYWLHGKLDELRIYNRAINQQEIDTLCGILSTPKVPCDIYIPNAFTPNQHADNECFKPRTTATYTDYQLSIYNRWGKQIFTTNNPNDCWDGQYLNAPCDMGTYFYYLSATIDCGKITQKGDVLLIR
jgi:gliding motility-associated-like protein